LCSLARFFPLPSHAAAFVLQARTSLSFLCFSRSSCLGNIEVIILMQL
jgi:hypothetical protein